MARIPGELRPFWESCFIYGFGLCAHCGAEQPFESSHKKFSDDWWLDEAKAMKQAGWVVPEPHSPVCPKCAEMRHVRHDPLAYTIGDEF